MRLAVVCFALLICHHALAQDVAPRPPAVSTQDVPAVSAALMERLQRYQNVRAARFEGWAPDGNGILISTRFGDTTQLHRVYEPGGRREQVTFFSESVDGRFIPFPRTALPTGKKGKDGKDNALLVSMARGGDENYQIFYLDPKIGRPSLLTDGKSRNLLAAVRDDGQKIVIGSNQRNGRDTDLYMADPRKPGSMKMLMETNGQFWTPTDWSPDGSRLLINHYVSINETYPAILDVATGEMKPIPVPGKGKVAFGTLEFAPDGKSVYITSDANSEFQQLGRMNLDTFAVNWLTTDIPWDVEAVVVDQDSGRVAFTTNEDGASGLYLLDGDRYSRLKTPLGIVGELAFSVDGTQLGFTLARPDRPADAYSLDIAKEKLTRWTFSETGGLDPTGFVAPEQIKFRTFDKRMIPAYYYKPRQASKENPAAVVINIHGGPESQYRPIFSGQTQFFVNEAGIAVLAPNVRGSAGYGKTYLRLDNAEKREDSVRDIGALLDWIAAQPELDASRVAVYGGSYGGYMVLASLTNFPERIKAGVDIVGIASFRTFLLNTSAYRRDLRRAEYGDERDPKMLKVFDRIDPLNNTHKIRSALLVAHGRNDPRVPFSEAEQIAEKVRGNGREVWSLYADNEGHGGWRRQNRDYLDAVVVLFFERYLRR